MAFQSVVLTFEFFLASGYFHFPLDRYHKPDFFVAGGSWTLEGQKRVHAFVAGGSKKRVHAPLSCM